jgi:hypothetical protein
MRYYIDESDPLHPALVREIDNSTTEILAENIENFKVTYDLQSGVRSDPDPADLNLIRQVNFFVIGRTRNQDDRWEQGVHSLTGDQDGFRRYKLATQIFFRNLQS